jgi:acetoacetate decarboxylase
MNSSGTDVIESYSTPRDAPLVPAFPVAYRDVSILTACYRTDPKALAEYLPEPFEPFGDVVMVHLYDMPDVQHFGHVHECNVMIGARAEGIVPAGFTTALYNDSDGALALGREVHGQPKKLARVTLETRGDLTVGVLERNGIDVAVVTAPYKSQAGDLSDLTRHFDFTENLNLKLIPHIDGSVAVAQVTARRLSDVTVHECWTSRCTVQLTPNAQAPLWRLPVIEPLTATYWRADFTLVPGRVVYDYQQWEDDAPKTVA